MNGLILAAGALTVVCGSGSEAAGPAYLPGTGGTVLRIPVGDKIDVEKMAKAGGPVVRLTYGGRSIQAPVIRFCRGESLCDVWVTGGDFCITQYPKGQINPPRPRPGESAEQHLKRWESWLSPRGPRPRIEPSGRVGRVFEAHHDDCRPPPV